MRRLYLAGPDVFMPDAHALAAEKKALCGRYGFAGLHPLDNEVAAGLSPGAQAMAIFRGNMALMAAADGIIADLTPFRGPSADPGTVFELGWMAGRGGAVFGYSLVGDGFRARTVAALGLDAGSSTDAAGAVIEDFGLGDNLMIDCALMAGGVSVVEGFERCLQAARAYFDGGGDGVAM